MKFIMKIGLRKIFILTVSIFLMAAPIFVFAQWTGLVPCGSSKTAPNCSVACFYVMIDNVIKFLLFYLAVPLAATGIMAAGILMLLGGSERNITKGRDILKYVVIGLFIAFAGYLIVDLILGNLLNSSGPYMPWNKFPSGTCTGIPNS